MRSRALRAACVLLLSYESKPGLCKRLVVVVVQRLRLSRQRQKHVNEQGRTT